MPSFPVAGLLFFHACTTEHGRQASERHGQTRAPGGLASDCEQDDSRKLVKGGEKGKTEISMEGESKTDGRNSFPFDVRQSR